MPSLREGARPASAKLARDPDSFLIGVDWALERLSSDSLSTQLKIADETVHWLIHERTELVLMLRELLKRHPSETEISEKFMSFTGQDV